MDQAIRAVNAGVGFVRGGVAWDEYEPSEGVYNLPLLDKLQAVVTYLAEHDVQTTLIVQNSPSWARACHQRGGALYYDADPLMDCTSNNRPPTPDRYHPWQRFLSAIVDSVPEVNHWGVWNEPNDSAFLTPGPGQDVGEVYSTLVHYAAGVIHARGKKVLAPELAVHDNAIAFLNDFINRAAWTTDILTFHVYADDPAAWMHTITYNTFVQYTSLPIWLTESGPATTPGPEIFEDRRQADQMLRTYERNAEALQGANPRWQASFPFILAINNVDPGPGNWTSGWPAAYGYAMITDIGDGSEEHVRFAFNCLSYYAHYRTRIGINTNCNQPYKRTGDPVGPWMPGRW